MIYHCKKSTVLNIHPKVTYHCIYCYEKETEEGGDGEAVGSEHSGEEDVDEEKKKEDGEDQDRDQDEKEGEDQYEDENKRCDEDEYLG